MCVFNLDWFYKKMFPMKVDHFSSILSRNIRSDFFFKLINKKNYFNLPKKFVFCLFYMVTICLGSSSLKYISVVDFLEKVFV